jgi:NADPH-dependent 2,4-dienoyl-CoA reductase/sulfur reductase-like enzyme
MEDEFLNDTQDKFVIIGGGIAALSAAQAIRKRNRTSQIVMLSEEEYRPYYRPALSDLLSEDLPDNRLYVFDQEWYTENNVELRTGIRVVRIEPDRQVVKTERDESIPYTKLIVATGARSNIPLLREPKTKAFTPAQLKDALQLKAPSSRAVRRW